MLLCVWLLEFHVVVVSLSAETNLKIKVYYLDRWLIYKQKNTYVTHKDIFNQENLKKSIYLSIKLLVVNFIDLKMASQGSK